jgi:hypothetical protein
MRQRGVGLSRIQGLAEEKLKKKSKLMDVLVTVREVHTQQHLVKGVKSIADAKAVVADGDCSNVTLLESTFEYSHTLDPETWEAVKLTKKQVKDIEGGK